MASVCGIQTDSTASDQGRADLQELVILLLHLGILLQYLVMLLLQGIHCFFQASVLFQDCCN